MGRGHRQAAHPRPRARGSRAERRDERCVQPRRQRIVTASADRTTRVWDAATGKPLTRPLEHHDHVVHVAFSPDGTRIVTASWDKTARVWDALTGKPVTSQLEHQAAV